MFKKLLKKKQHDYELMCEDFTRCLAHTIFDAQMAEKRDRYEELKFVGTRNPFMNGALNLQYNYAVKKISKEEI